MFCPKCGSQIPDNASFCAKCGAQVQMTTQAAQSASVAAQSIPAPASKRGPSGKLIGAAVAVVAAVVIVAAGFATNWFGIASGRGADEPIYVVKSQTTISNGERTVMEYEYDAQGNRILVKGSFSDYMDGRSLAIEHDENGFVTGFGPESGQPDEWVTVSNEFDALGRLEASVVLIPGKSAVRARYSYYEETDRVSQVEYSADGELGDVWEALYAGLGPQFPWIGVAWTVLMGGDRYIVTYSDSGQMNSVEWSSTTSDLSGPSREERAGQTIENESNDGTQAKYTYNEHGYVVHWSRENSGSDSMSPYSTSSDLTYELVTSPSRAVATFGRLYN